MLPRALYERLRSTILENQRTRRLSSINRD
jgi:hypothetical protein